MRAGTRLLLQLRSTHAPTPSSLHSSLLDALLPCTSSTLHQTADNSTGVCAHVQLHREHSVQRHHASTDRGASTLIDCSSSNTSLAQPHAQHSPVHQSSVESSASACAQAHEGEPTPQSSASASRHRSRRRQLSSSGTHQTPVRPLSNNGFSVGQQGEGESLASWLQHSRHSSSFGGASVLGLRYASSSSSCRGLGSESGLGSSDLSSSRSLCEQGGSSSDLAHISDDTLPSDLTTNISDVLATSATEPHVTISIFRDAAQAMQWVHDSTGLPWWASIPLTTLSLRLALLPVSMWQAKTVRTNYMVYKEAAAMTDRQLGIEPPSASPSDQAKQRQPEQQMSAADRVKRGKQVLSNFTLLRAKLEAPHPAWIVINPLIQVPVFVVTGMTLRMMGNVSWPGMSSEGALWFPDLTQVAMITSFTDDAWSLAFPMGPTGLILPLSIFAATLTSLRIGFGAAGAQAAPADDWVGKFLKVLPPLLYGMTFVNLWVKLQLSHCALLHWAASSAFTLGLQLSLQRPAFRAAFNLPSPKDLQALLARLSGQQLQELADAAESLAGTNRGYVTSALPQKLVKQVSEEDSPDVLVVLGAQHSAQHRFKEALFCLDKALQLQPAHVRAHYSRGQVFSLSGRWLDAQACFERAAELAPENSTEKGQATYCVATAMHTQGNAEGAVDAYRQADALWPNQPVISFSMVNALLALNRQQDAKRVVDRALSMDALRDARSPFRAQFEKIKREIGEG